MPFFDPIRIGATGALADFTVDRSLRFNDNDSTYLTRTPSGDGNRRTFTISFWVKRANFTSGHIFQQRADSNDSRQFAISFRSDNNLRVLAQDGGSTVLQLDTTQVFRDPSAWYHIVVAIDSTQSTQSDRQKLYVNGEQITDFDTSTQTSQDRQFSVNHASKRILLGNQRPNSSSTLSNYFDGYLAEYHLIDGLQLTPTSFGETNSTTGQWNPIDTSGLTFGTNGFRLQFADNSGTTATTLGKDTSGNSNNFTPNNFSVSAGAGNDSVEDTPTNNFPTLNPLNNNPYSSSGYPSPTFTNGNLEWTTNTTSQVNYAESTMYFPKSGKWYIEVTVDNLNIGSGVGYAQLSVRSNTGGSRYLWWVYSSPYYQINTNSGTQTIGSISNGDIVQVAYDSDTGNVWFGKNNSWYLSGDPANGTAMSPATTVVNDFARFFVAGRSGSAANIVDVNFGQQAFSYTPPTGFKALNSANLPDPTILLPNKHFETLTYTGDSNTSRNITGLQFQPDWVWIKRRSASANHRALDSVRGSTKELYPNLTNAESTFTGISSFDSNGFTLATADSNYNLNTATYVAWNWNGGDTDGKTYTVTVVSDSGNKYRFDGYGTSAVTLDLAEGGTYIFDWSDSSAQSHPIRFSTTSDGTHGGGSEYTTGVTKDDSAYKTTITIAASAPTLYYYCQNHSGMGGQVNTNSTLGSSNFDGSIQSTVKVNASAGFSIVSYAGNQSSAYTIGHGLGVAPKIIFTKSRTDNVNWGVYYSILGTNTNYLTLNTSDAQGANNNSEMSGVFAVLNSSTVQMSYTAFGNAGSSLIMYAFSEVAGYSKFGSYQANGDSDGPFVFTGFRPAWILIKNTSLGQPWVLMDNKINPHNLADTRLSPSSSAAESATLDNHIDILSNGFKVRSPGSSDINYSTSYPNHIYLAFAESPFKNARAR